jgi:hypothetical protein
MPKRLVTEMELYAALMEAVRKLAPLGGDREIPLNVACDVMTSMMADLLAAAPEAHELEQIVALFRQRLEAALARRDEGAGHA